MNYEDRTALVKAGHVPPKLLIERRSEGPVTCLRLSGAVDEQFDGPGLATTLRARWLILDLGGVDRISSFGIRQWIDFIIAAAGRVEAIFFVECSPKMVDQFNMVANFGGSGSVVSFYAPYRCDTCDHDRRRLFRIDEETPLWRAGQAPAFACPMCGNPEYFDEDPATYFSYVAQQNHVTLPQEVTAFLKAELSYGQGGHRKLKIEKRIDGRTTYVTLSGDLDSDLRAQKLADGLEGDVVFDLGGVLSIDPVGTAQWRRLLQILESKSGDGEQVDRVHLLATPALFLERLGRPEDLTRKGQVLSVLVPYNCPRCRATTQRLVDFVTHNAELRAGRVPRTQCSACGGPASCVASETWLARLAALPTPQLSEALRQSVVRLSATSLPAPRTSAQANPTLPPPGQSAPAWSLQQPAPERAAPRPEEPQDTRPVPKLVPGLAARVGDLLHQVPGLLPGLLVVLMALSGAIVYRILAPQAGRKTAGGWLVVDGAQKQPPGWSEERRGRDLTFIGRSSVLPDRQNAVEQAEVAAQAELARRLGEELAGASPEWKAAIFSQYEPAVRAANDEQEGAEKASKGEAAARLSAARLRIFEAEKRVAAALRQLGGELPAAEVYWEKLSRTDKTSPHEQAYQAMARIELSRPAYGRLLSLYGKAETWQRNRVLPTFPMLGWRYDLSSGAVVAQVEPHTRLANAGLTPGDVVLSVKGRDVRDAADLARTLEQIAGEPGVVLLKVQRGDRLLDVQLPAANRGVRRTPLPLRAPTVGKKPGR